MNEKNNAVEERRANLTINRAAEALRALVGRRVHVRTERRTELLAEIVCPALVERVDVLPRPARDDDHLLSVLFERDGAVSVPWWGLGLRLDEADILRYEVYEGGAVELALTDGLSVTFWPTREA